MGIQKIIVDNETLIDFSDQSISPEYVAEKVNFYDKKGEKVFGSLKEQESITITPSENAQRIYGGIYLPKSSNIHIEGEPNLKPYNIANGISIFGIKGTSGDIIDDYLQFFRIGRILKLSPTIDYVAPSLFENNSTIEDIIVSCEEAAFGNRSFANTSSLLTLDLSLIKGSITLGNSSFENSNIQTIILNNNGCPELVINDYAFSNSKLTSILKSSQYEHIDLNEGMINLQHIKFLGKKAFENCYNIKAAIFQSEGSVSLIIEDEPFLGCERLEYIDFGDIFNGYNSIGDLKLNKLSKLKVIDMHPANYTSTACGNAFQNLTKLEQINLYGPISLNAQAMFAGCTNILNISASMVNHISENCFYSLGTARATPPSFYFGEYLPHGDRITIDTNAFQSANIYNLEIGNSYCAAVINTKAFYGATIHTLRIKSGAAIINSNAFWGVTKTGYPTKIYLELLDMYKTTLEDNCFSQESGFIEFNLYINPEILIGQPVRVWEQYVTPSSDDKIITTITYDINSDEKIKSYETKYVDGRLVFSKIVTQNIIYQ